MVFVFPDSFWKTFFLWDLLIVIAIGQKFQRIILGLSCFWKIGVRFHCCYIHLCCTCTIITLQFHSKNWFMESAWIFYINLQFINNIYNFLYAIVGDYFRSGISWYIDLATISFIKKQSFLRLTFVFLMI